MENITTLRNLIGTPSPTWGAAQAWWVGTENTVTSLNEALSQQDRVNEIIHELCRDVDADPHAVSLSRGYLRGFSPLDTSSPNKALRPLFGEREGMYIPDRRVPEGKEFAEKILRLLPGPAVTELVRSIGGVEGEHSEATSPGRFKVRRASVVLGHGDNVRPVLLASFLPEDSSSTLSVDPSLWERRPIEELHALIEAEES